MRQQSEVDVPKRDKASILKKYCVEDLTRLSTVSGSRPGVTEGMRRSVNCVVQDNNTWCSYQMCEKPYEI